MATVKKRKLFIPRSRIRGGKSPCDYCTGKCCRYFSLPIDTPTAWDDYDSIRWYLAHKKTMVYVEKGTWYLVVMTDCNYLLPDNRCAIYHDRPKICRDYTTDECEYDADWSFEKVFETPEQIWEYAEAILPRRRIRGGKPPRDYFASKSHRSFSLPISTPTDRDDYDAIRWYLAHKKTVVYVEKGTWYLVVMTDNRRAICHDHPRISRDYTTYEREHDADRVFETPEQIWEYAETTLPPKRKELAAKSNGLVILNGPV